MFGRARFDLARFGVPTGDTVVALYGSAAETMDGIFRVAENIHLEANGAEGVSGRAVAIQGVLLRGDGAEALAAKSNALAGVLLRGYAAEALGAETALGANLYLAARGAEEVRRALSLGADVSLEADAAEALDAGAALGANVYLAARAYEILSALCGAETQEVFVAMLDVELAPGDVLVMDSDHYTVFRNGENALETHSGDWIRLSRGARSLLVESGSPATLSGSMLYTERYL